MTKRGPKSAAARATASVSPEPRRPPPPGDLKGKERQIWQDTVATMPCDWFDPVHEPMLKAFCRHVVSADRLTSLVGAFKDDWLREEGGLQRLDKLLAMRERESRALVMCARSMRLTKQSQMHPRSAGRSVANSPVGPRPWDHSDE